MSIQFFKDHFKIGINTFTIPIKKRKDNNWLVICHVYIMLQTFIYFFNYSTKLFQILHLNKILTRAKFGERIIFT